MKTLLKTAIAALTVVGFALSPQQAQGITYDFSNLTDNNDTDAAIGEAQMFVDVLEVSGQPNQALFRFRNEGPAASSITDVYFDDGTLLGIASITSSAGVSFSQGASPGNLPGGNNLTPVFETTAGFLSDSNPPAQPNGVNPGEWLEITFNLKASQTYADVVQALVLAGEPGGLRIGIRVQGFDGGGSEGFVNNPGVPTPDGGATAALLGLGFLGLAALARKRS